MNRLSRSILLGALTLLPAPLACAQDKAPATPPTSTDAMVARASDLLQDAEASWGEDREHAESVLHEGVALLDAVESSSAAPGAELERTLGASYLLLGENGRAILHLRRAQKLDPTSRAIRETLDAARARVGSPPPPDASERAKRAVLFWRGFVSRRALLVAAIGAWVIAWTLLLARRLGAPTSMAKLGLASLVLSFVPAGALASEEVITRLREDAVVVQDGVIARNGPSNDLYPATFTEPVEPGLEVVVLERRDGWARARLASGQDTWLPNAAIEAVTPRRASR
ncbi:MAG: hypothetical protein R3B57_11240 [Phycisphaerales bacterium]